MLGETRKKETEERTRQVVSELALASRARVAQEHRPSYQLAFGLQAVSVLLDIIAVFLTFWVSYVLRYNFRIGAMVPITRDTLEFDQWARHALAGIVLTVLVFGARGVYQVRRKLTWVDYVPLVISSYGLAIAGVVLFAFFVQFSPSRAIYLYVLVIGSVLLLGHRAITRYVRRKLLEQGRGVDYALIAGHTENARRLAQSLLGQPQWGYKLLGYVANEGAPDRMNVASEAGIRSTDRLGEASDLSRLVQQHHIDDVFIIEADYSNDEIAEMVESCRAVGVQFRVVPELLQISMDRVDITEINGVPLIGVRDASIRGWNALLKRTSDVLMAGAILLVAAIPTAILVWMIHRDSDGAAFYRQVRVGQNGKPFEILKFRTMYIDADQRRDALVEESGVDARLFKDRNDPRITKVGAILRKFSIDELPQVWNVFIGDMTFVGPRPPLPREVAEYQTWHQQRLLVRPGMTGLWQVSGRSDLTFDQMVRLDLYYAENWSLWLDAKILLRTIPAVLFSRGAY